MSCPRLLNLLCLCACWLAPAPGGAVLDGTSPAAARAPRTDPDSTVRTILVPSQAAPRLGSPRSARRSSPFRPVRGSADRLQLRTPDLQFRRPVELRLDAFDGRLRWKRVRVLCMVCDHSHVVMLDSTLVQFSHPSLVTRSVAALFFSGHTTDPRACTWSALVRSLALRAELFRRHPDGPPNAVLDTPDGRGFWLGSPFFAISIMGRLALGPFFALLGGAPLAR